MGRVCCNVVFEPFGSGFLSLTKREIEVLKLIAREFVNHEIADKLKIAEQTVETHRRNIIRKLGVRNAVGLVRYAYKHGLIEDDNL